MRARVAAVVSLGSASGAKKPCATISRPGTGRRLAKAAHHVERNVIAAGNAVVEEQAEQLRRLGRLDIALLPQFARERLRQGLARLDPAARQVPAAHVAVPDQENASLAVDHQRRGRRASWRA